MSRLAAEAPIRYSQNAFRILSLPVTASGPEIQLRADEICVRVKMGETCQYLYDFAWMGPLERTEESVRDALHRLSDPIQRTREELAWFWVWGPQDEEALARLRRNDKAGALRIWESRRGAGGEASIVAAFNQVILTHSAVIGEELLLLSDLGSLIQLDSDEAHWKSWRLTLEGWYALIQEEQFWMLLKCVAKARSDARLVDSTIEELRNNLLGEVLQPSLVFLQQALQGREVARAKRHAEAIRQAHLPEESFKPWFAESLRPYADTLREACEAAIQALREQRVEELEPSAVRPTCLQLYQQLRDRTLEALALGELLDAENHTEFAVERDRYGETLRQIAIPMANGGHAYADAMRLTEEALRWAVSPSAQARLKEDQKTLGELLGATEQRQEASEATAASPEAGAPVGPQAGRASAPEQDKKTPQVLDVKLNAQGRYSYHGICCCCLAKTNDVETVQGRRSEYQVIRNVTHTLRVTLPFCKTCQGHAGEEAKRTIWWWVVTAGVALLSFLTLDIPGANWLLPTTLVFLSNGITVLCLNRWLPRKLIVIPHVSRSIPVQMRLLEEDSFVLRFRNVQFGHIFLEGNRAIVLEQTVMELPKSFLNILQAFNDRHGLATSVIAGFFLLASLAVLPSATQTEHRYQSSTSSPLQGRQVFSQREVVGQALDRERAAFASEQQVFERDAERLEDIRQQVDTLAAQINAIDRMYNVDALPEEIYNQRLPLVVQHNALVEEHEQLRVELVNRAENLEARRLSFNAKIEAYNKGMRR